MPATSEEKYRNTLTAMGLSPESVDYIATRHDSAAATRIYWTGIVLYLFLFLGLSAGAAMMGHRLIFEDLRNLRTQGANVLFYDAIWCMNLFPAMILAAALPGWIVYSILERFPRANELVALKSIDAMTRRNGKYSGTSSDITNPLLLKNLIDDTFRSLPIHEALRYYNRKSTRWTKWIGLFALAVFIPLVALDAGNYTVITPDGVHAAPYGSFQERRESWNDVDRVETGCYYFGGSGRHVETRYDIFFNDGMDIDLFSVHDIFGMKVTSQKIDNVAQIDAILAKTGKPFRLAKMTRGVYAGEPFFNKGCYGELQKIYHGDDYAKLVSLLRLANYQPMMQEK